MKCFLCRVTRKLIGMNLKVESVNEEVNKTPHKTKVTAVIWMFFVVCLVGGHRLFARILHRLISAVTRSFRLLVGETVHNKSDL